MQESHHGLLLFDRVPVLHLGIAGPTGANGAITASDDDDIVITVVYSALDQPPLAIVGCWKQFHPRGDAIKLKKNLHDFLTFYLKVLVCRADEHLVLLVHDQVCPRSRLPQPNGPALKAPRCADAAAPSMKCNCVRGAPYRQGTGRARTGTLASAVPWITRLGTRMSARGRARASNCSSSFANTRRPATRVATRTTSDARTTPPSLRSREGAAGSRGSILPPGDTCWSIRLEVPDCGVRAQRSPHFIT